MRQWLNRHKTHSFSCLKKLDAQSWVGENDLICQFPGFGTDLISFSTYFKAGVRIFCFSIWRSISMRAGPAFLQFDWSKASLSMDLPVFVHSLTKTSFKFLSRQGRYREAFYVLTNLLLQSTQREPYKALVLSSPHAVRRTTLSFAWV